MGDKCVQNIFYTCIRLSKKIITLEDRSQGSSEMAQQLRALSLLQRPTGWLLTICNSGSRSFHTHFWPPQAPETHMVYMHAGKHIHKENFKKLKTRINLGLERWISVKEHCFCRETGFVF